MYRDISGRLKTPCCWFFFYLLFLLLWWVFFLFFTNESGLRTLSNAQARALALLPGKLSILYKRRYVLLQTDPSCQTNSIVKYIPCLCKCFRPFNGNMNLKRSSIGSQCSEWSDLMFSKQLMLPMEEKD